MANERKVRVVVPVDQILPVAGGEVVEDDNLMSLTHELIDQMTADKASATRH